MKTSTDFCPENKSSDDQSGQRRPAFGRIVEVTDEDENIVPVFISVTEFNR